jgi:hypothetical protein
MTPQYYLDFAERFVGAIQSGDTDTVRACYAPDAKLWHNTDGVEQSVDQNMKVLDWFIKTLPDRNYGSRGARPCPTASCSSMSWRPPCPTAASGAWTPAW